MTERNWDSSIIINPARDNMIRENASRKDTIYSSAFGDRDFSKAFDHCASGELADAYRSIGEVQHGDSKSRLEQIITPYRKDRISQKIVEVPVFDSLSNWREIDNDDIKKIDDDLSLSLQVQEAAKMARLTGCALLLPIIKDVDGKIIPFNQELSGVLERNNWLVIDKVVVLSESVSFGDEIEQDFYKDWYKYPKRIDAGNKQIHPSRCAIIGNITHSFFDSIIGAVSDYYESLRRVQIAVRRNSAFVLESDFDQVKRFIEASYQATGKVINLDVITQERARSLFQNLNDVNVAVINAGEKVHNFQASNIGDLTKHVEQNMRILSGMGDMPFSRLFGKSEGGLNNSSQIDFENYSQSLDGYKASDVEPGLNVLDRIISRINGIEFTRSQWKWNPTRAEEIRLRLAGQAMQQEVAPSA